LTVQQHTNPKTIKKGVKSKSKKSLEKKIGGQFLLKGQEPERWRHQFVYL
jgi:hypothetical protein